jgi:hypothetical protein
MAFVCSASIDGYTEMYNRQNLAEACYRMATRGGYVLAFSKRVAADMPDLTWNEYRNVLLANGHGFCGYAEVVVKNAFGRD